MQRTVRARSTAALVLSAALALAACDDPAVSDDAGRADAGLEQDGGFASDAGPGDAGLADGGEASCEACEVGEACLRGVCVADCGEDASALDAALGETLTPVAHFCRSAIAYEVGVDDDGPVVWDLSATTEGTVTTFVLSRWALDPSTAPSPTEVATTTHDTGTLETMVYPGGYVGVDPSGARALFGYTTSEAGFPGGLFIADVASGAVERTLEAPSNFDVAWLDEGRLLVNGAGLEGAVAGQGLYAHELGPARSVHVATGFGAYSGSVAVGPSYVLVGGTSDALAPLVYFLPQSRLNAALADEVPVDMSDDAAARPVLDPDGAPLPSAFSLVGERVVVTAFGAPITSYATEVTDGSITLADPRVLATGAPFGDALYAGEGQLLLAHPGGLLLVRD